MVMINPRRIIARPTQTSLLLVVFLSIFATFSHTQEVCNSQTNYCFQISLPDVNASDNEKNVVTFRLEAPSNVGWVGLGIGQSMLNSYIMVAWPNSDGTITISQRRASQYNEPRPTGQSDLTLDPSSGIQNGKMVAIIKRPMSVQGSTISAGKQAFVWAFCNTGPSDSSQDASLAKHGYNGGQTVNLVVPDSSSSSPSSPSSNSSSPSSPSIEYTSEDTGLVPYQKFAISHAAFMVMALFISAPTAVFIARFGRTAMPKTWFHLHWSIQVFGTAVFVLTGYILIKTQGNQYDGQYKDPHIVIGNIIVWGIFAQVILGLIHHKLFSPTRGYVPWWTKLHWWFGRLLFTLALFQVPFGLKLYGAPTFLFILYGIYLVIIVCLFAFSSARMERSRHASLNSDSSLSEANKVVMSN